MRNTLAPPEPLIVTKEKDLVMPVKHVRNDDRTANRKPILVLTELALLATLEIIRSIQLVIAEKLPDTAVELIGSGFDRGIEDGGSGTAELRAEV